MNSPAPPMSLVNLPRTFTPNDAQQIVVYLQKRVRIENLDEANSLTTLVASFVAFMNRYFDDQIAKQNASAPASPPAPPAEPPADEAANG